MNPTLKKYLLPAILSFVFLFFLFKLIGDPKAFIENIFNLNPYYLGLAFIFYTIVAIARSLRIQAVYPEEKYPLGKLVAVSNLHTFISNVFPSRLGEFSFIYLMRKVFGQHAGRNTIALIFVRIMDTFTVASFFIVSAGIVGFTHAGIDHLWVFFMLVVLLGLASFYLDILVNIGVSLVKAIISLVKLEGVSPVRKLLDFLDALLGFKMLRSKGVYGRTMFLSFVVWTFLMLANKAMTMAMGLDLTFPVLFFASTGAVLTSLIPVTTFAAVGTYELGWIGAFALIGMGREEAIITGLTIHTINFVFSAILGGLGFLVINKSTRQQETP